jgi:hypothetical protein
MKKWILGVVSLALLFVVGCQKEPVVESATLSFNRDVVEVKAEGESVRLIYEVLAPVEGMTLEVKCDALMDAVENAKGEIIYRDSVRVEIITRYEKEYININHASNAELDSIIRSNI